MNASLVSSSCDAKNIWTKEDIAKKVSQSRIVVFSKGIKGHSKCGYSERVLSIIAQSGKPYEIIDIDTEPSIAPALRTFSGTREVPLLYANGKMISCSDELHHPKAESELEIELEKAFNN